MQSVSSDFPEAIPILIKMGYDVNYTYEGKSALYLACLR